MKDSFAVGMELLADMVRRSNFPPEEIDRQKGADHLRAAGEP
jgi:predicted Zn-dependent peptidase